ncbi:MAG: Uma2 family endonuclease [Chloroflexi bacterium]|nr:Uma2 family endonuclease [Chloroflexota bacterium]MBI5713934.1 Uma2 family endonuclease [Chloroflexota bacterium]
MAVLDRSPKHYATHPPLVVEKILPLNNGDHLTRREFERRYEATAEKVKAELIEGVVYMASPVYLPHGESHGSMATWLGTYRAHTSKIRVADNVTIRLDAENEVQPDLAAWVEGRKVHHSQEGYLEGAPELVIEIAVSSASYDLYEKLRVYRRNGIQEYIVWRVLDQKIDWFELKDGEYVPFMPDVSGVIKSKVFPGLWLVVNDLLNGDLAKVLAKLNEGLTAEEHKDFAQKLNG